MSAGARERFAGGAHFTAHRESKPQIVVFPEVLSLVETAYFINQTTFGNNGGGGDDGIDLEQGLNDEAFKW